MENLTESILDGLAKLILNDKISLDRELYQLLEEYNYQRYNEQIPSYEVSSIDTIQDLDNPVVNGYFQAHFFDDIRFSWIPLDYLSEKDAQAEKEGLREYLNSQPSFLDDIKVMVKK